MTTKIKAVAFDFDGVIAETTKLKSELFLKMFEGLPEYSAIVDYEKIHQALPRRKKIDDILKTILNINHGKSIDFYLNKYADDLAEVLPKAPIVKGCEMFIQSLQSNQISLFIVSSGMATEIENYLGPSRIKFFQQIFDAATAKPVALRQIMRLQFLQSSELLFLGDSNFDYKAAQEAPCEFIAINPDVVFPPEVKCFADFSVFDQTLLR